jgi:hypothetical protein
VSNVATKVCLGPAHSGPARIPLDREHWYFYGNSPWARLHGMVGKPIARCRMCRALQHPHSLIPAARIERFARELVERCGGYKQAERACGVGERTLRRIVIREKRSIQKVTAGRILVALDEQRKYDRRNGASPRFMEARRAQARIEERLDRDGCG